MWRQKFYLLRKLICQHFGVTYVPLMLSTSASYNDKVKIFDISVLFEEGMGRGAQSFFIQLTCYNLILTFFIQTLRQ